NLSSPPVPPSGGVTQTVTATLLVTLTPTPTPTATATVLPIGAVQGSVADTDDGLTHTSPLVGQTVSVQAVIYQTTVERTSSGGSNRGFFVQNTASTADSDPNSSDGIFVFMGSATSIPRDGGGAYAPVVGDEIVLRGRVSEFFNLTELTSPTLVQIVRSGVN